jgi:hypothetical protein
VHGEIGGHAPTLPTQIGQHRSWPAIDPPRSAGAALTLDGFFGWPLSAVAS